MTSEDGRHLYEFQAALLPEEYELVKLRLANIALTPFVYSQLVVEAPLHALLPAEQIEEEFHTEYLDRLLIKNQPAYLATKASMMRFMRTLPDISQGRRERAWGSIQGHAEELHNPLAHFQCDCELTPIFHKRPLAYASRFDPRVKLRGVTPDSLTKWQITGDPRVGRLIRQYIDALPR